MSAKDNGGQAFPCSVIHYNEEKVEAEWIREGGMSLRDWFAGQACAGFRA